MTKHLCGCAAIALAALLADNSASAIELPTAASASPAVRPGNLSSSVSGVVSTIDASGGSLTLDGKRRYPFVAATLVVRRQSDASSAAGVADIKVGSRVSLTIQRKTASSQPTVSEVWIAP